MPGPDLRDERRTTITVPEAADYLGIGRSLAYAAARQGEIPTLKIGRRLVVPVAALRKMLDADAVAGGEAA